MDWENTQVSCWCWIYIPGEKNKIKKEKKIIKLLPHVGQYQADRPTCTGKFYFFHTAIFFCFFFDVL